MDPFQAKFHYFHQSEKPENHSSTFKFLGFGYGSWLIKLCVSVHGLQRRMGYLFEAILFCNSGKIVKFWNENFDENFDIFDCSSEFTKSFEISSRQSRVNMLNNISPKAQLLEKFWCRVRNVSKLESWVQILKNQKILWKIKHLHVSNTTNPLGPCVARNV